MNSSGSPKAERIILALDVDTPQEADAVLCHLPQLCWVKIGMQLALKADASWIAALKARGLKVFLDYKFLDIPRTVAAAVRNAAALGVDMLTVHAAPQVVCAAVEHAGETRVLAVTVLTSMDQDDLNADGAGLPLQELVCLRARHACEAGAHGLVASASEVPMLRQLLGCQPLMVTPGIRPAWASSGDQKRTTTPCEALDKGADVLVIGRPILVPPEGMTPAQAFDAIVGDLDAHPA